MRRLIFLIPMLLLLVGCATTTNSGRTFTGEASWYGGKFHGRTTASGEKFNKNALTAAHKDLAFGTRCRVTNIANNKSVVVRINDRFPGTKGRVIDLSEEAFSRIADTRAGVIRVKVEVLE